MIRPDLVLPLASIFLLQLDPFFGLYLQLSSLRIV